ncbi:MAG: hypothetical protein AAGG65_00890 [Pseudomonadota bacterium]
MTAERVGWIARIEVDRHVLAAAKGGPGAQLPRLVAAVRQGVLRRNQILGGSQLQDDDLGWKLVEMQHRGDAVWTEAHPAFPLAAQTRKHSLADVTAQTIKTAIGSRQRLTAKQILSQRGGRSRHRPLSSGYVVEVYLKRWARRQNGRRQVRHQSGNLICSGLGSSRAGPQQHQERQDNGTRSYRRPPHLSH